MMIELIVSLIGLAGIGLCLLLCVLHKQRRVHLMTYRLSDEIKEHSDTLYRQLEALQALYLELKMDTGLPVMRGSCASPDFILLITRCVREKRPKVVIECGSGTSTVALARATQLNGEGHVYSLEHMLEYAIQTRENLDRLGLSEWATIIDAPLVPYDLDDVSYMWYDDRGIPDQEIDMLVVDGPPMLTGPQARYPTGPVLFPRLSPNGAAFLDDASRKDETEIVERWLEEFSDLKRRDHDCEKGCVSLSYIGGCSDQQLSPEAGFR